MLGKTPQIIEHQGKLYITGSEFSELFIRDSNPSVHNELNSTFALHETIREKMQTPMKVANFRKIDWNALEKGPLGRQRSPRRFGKSPFLAKQRKLSLNVGGKFFRPGNLSPEPSESALDPSSRMQ